MKNSKLIALICLLGIFFTSCDKEESKREWESFFNYTIEDIVGSYSYSNVSDAFDDLTENAYCHICEDATITIEPYQEIENSIELKLRCPSAVFNRTFRGQPTLNDDDFLILMSNSTWDPHPDYELTAYVYKNSKGQVRLHGFATHVINSGTTDEYKINYYFDVIKN